MAISNAVGTERVAKVVGYEVQKGNFLESSPNLPMRVAIFGQANTNMQSGLTNAPVQVTSENEAGRLFGFGSQIHLAMRIIRSRTGDTTGGIPTWVYPQLAPSSPDAQIDLITVTGTPNAATAHTVYINGRSVIDGASLEIPISASDTVTTIATKIADAINLATSLPVTATSAAGVVTVTTKWQGESAGELDIRVDVGGTAAGVAYAITESQAAAGDSSAEITSSLELFGNNWNTIVVNPYPNTRNGLFETVNGVPASGSNVATGRYRGEVFKPFVVLNGNTDADTVSNVTSHLTADQVTVVQCPAPNSEGWDVEAAANVCALLARQAQDNPHLDVSGASYPDMPIPANEQIGIYATYNNRDLIVKSGGSTVIIETSRYKVEDLITSYHPENEIPPQFRYVRSLIQDWNVRYGYFLLELINVVDHSIIGNNQPTNVSRTLKPKQWVAILVGYFDDLALRSLIVEPEFSVESLEVQTGDTNPDRLETFFRYKRSPFVRIASTTAEAGFAFGLTA